MSTFPSTPTTRVIGPSTLIELQVGSIASGDAPLSIVNTDGAGIFQIQQGENAQLAVNILGGWYLADTESIEQVP